MFAVDVKHAANLNARAPSNENTITAMSILVSNRAGGNLLSLFSSCLVSLVNLFYSTVPWISTVKVAYRKLSDSVINFPVCGGRGKRRRRRRGRRVAEAAGP